jgi:hypothetical protein
MEEHEHLRANVPKDVLRTTFRDGTVQDVAKKVSFVLFGSLQQVLLRVCNRSLLGPFKTAGFLAYVATFVFL